jgi:hypothetical protein
MTAPLGSFTTPPRAPVSFWAIALPQAKIATANNHSHHRSGIKYPDRRDEEQRMNRFISGS